MKNSIAIIILVLVCSLILVLTDFGKTQAVVYDCREAHWHPDYPIEVKRACADLIREELEKERQENFKRKNLAT